MFGISGISGLSGCSQSQQQQQKTVTIDGQQFTLSGNPDQDAQNVASKLNISVEEAKSKLKEQLGDPQQPQQQSSGIGSTTIGNMLAGY